MSYPFGALIDWHVIFLVAGRRWKSPRHETDSSESNSLASSEIRRSTEIHDALNKEIDKQVVRLDRIRALQKEDHLHAVRGVHYGNKSEQLLLGNESASPSIESGTPSTQRSSLMTRLSLFTLRSSVYANSDEAPLLDSPATEKNGQDGISVSTYVGRVRDWIRTSAPVCWVQPIHSNRYLEPCAIVVTIVEPLPQRFRSLDIPSPSSISSYEQSSYLPETDTFFLPDVAGGPFEILAAEVRRGRWIEASPRKFWKFRESALRELKETGKLHWRKVDRWGLSWQDGWWRGDDRPVWDVEGKKWRDEVVRCG